MATYWCHNAKTGEIFSYKESEGLTDFPRGELLAYGDYVTTGFTSKEEAKQWAKKWGLVPSAVAQRRLMKKETVPTAVLCLYLM